MTETEEKKWAEGIIGSGVLTGEMVFQNISNKAIPNALYVNSNDLFFVIKTINCYPYSVRGVNLFFDSV